MKTKLTAISAALGLILSASANAALLDLGVAGQYNAFVFENFTSNGSDTEGAIAVGKDFTVSSYSTNLNSKAVNGYSLVVGEDLIYNNGSVSNGNIYYGASKSTTGFGFGGTYTTAPTASPVNFASEIAHLQTLSSNLTTLANTGNVLYQYGGITLTAGNANDPQVFNLNASEFGAVNNSTLSGFSSGQTIILNIFGSSAGMTGGTANSFSSYNTLFNFYDATQLSFTGSGPIGTVLATNATVQPGNGVINGNVIVKSWNSNIQINANHYFVPTDVPNLPTISAVPEPSTYAMLIAGLFCISMVSRRRNQQ